MPSTSGVSSPPPEPPHNLRARPLPAPDRYSPTHYGLSAALESTFYRDALSHPEWQLAMAGEIAALERTGMWDVVTPPPFVHPITCKWVYKIKTRSDGVPLSATKRVLWLAIFSRSRGAIMMRLLPLWLT